ncbi:unnamed protein product [Tenebrio molitor]|nr:unnamed protein product [Tenebrio molitor]
MVPTLINTIANFLYLMFGDVGRPQLCKTGFFHEIKRLFGRRPIQPVHITLETRSDSRCQLLLKINNNTCVLSAVKSRPTMQIVFIFRPEFSTASIRIDSAWDPHGKTSRTSTHANSHRPS